VPRWWSSKITSNGGTWTLVDEPIEKQPLALENFHVRGWQIKPRCTIDFWKGLHLAAFRRPFDLERVARYGADVEVAFDGERGYPLAAALADIAKGLQSPGKIATCLFLEFSSGSGGGILTLSHLTLRNRPGALILVPPEWSAGMNQQDLKSLTGLPVHQDSSARSQEFSPLADITTKELSCAKVVPRLCGDQNSFDD
jgi:hypothetical protein